MIDAGVIEVRRAAARPGRRSGLSQLWVVGLAAVAVIAGGVGMLLCALHWTRGGPWGFSDVVLMVVAWTGDVLGFTVGLWWWWRGPANSSMAGTT